MDVKLDKQSKIPVYLQIVDQLRAQIMCGALPSGSVLPSERGLAQMLEVHRNTVVKAYGELKSDAWIESRQGHRLRRRRPARPRRRTAGKGRREPPTSRAAA